jgi:DNA-binding MarR family transcriptional regulator
MTQLLDIEAFLTTARAGSFSAAGREIGVAASVVTKRVDRLEAQGYVTRTVSTEDGRSRTIALTVEGRALIDDLFPRHVDNERRLLAGLSSDEQVELARLLEKWGRALGAG